MSLEHSLECLREASPSLHSKTAQAPSTPDATALKDAKVTHEKDKCKKIGLDQHSNASTHTHTRTHAHACTRMHTHTHTHAHTHAHTKKTYPMGMSGRQGLMERNCVVKRLRRFARVLRICFSSCSSDCTQTIASKQSHTHTHTYTHIHTHTHTYTHSNDTRQIANKVA